MTTTKDLTHSMAHYLMTIHKLNESNGRARITDIAREMNLTKGSVSLAINGLKKKKLVDDSDSSKDMVLTKLGHTEVHRVLSSRSLVYHLLKDVLDVTDKSALDDSCAIEHLISENTQRKIFKFLKDRCCNGATDSLCLCDYRDWPSYVKGLKSE